MEDLRLVGELLVVVRDEDGRILSVEKKKNVIVNTGRAHVAKLLGGIETAYFFYIQVGTGTAMPTESDTELQSFFSEKEALVSFVEPFSVQFSASFRFTEDVTISECGVFSGPRASSPVMLCRQIFSPKKVSAGQFLDIVWTISVQILPKKKPACFAVCEETLKPAVKVGEVLRISSAHEEAFKPVVKVAETPQAGLMYDETLKSAVKVAEALQISSTHEETLKSAIEIVKTPQTNLTREVS